MNFLSNQKLRKEYSTYTGLAAIYIVTIGIAATVIIPVEENLIVAVFKSTIWPLYSLTKILS
jgi:hypothetical protein